MERLIVGVDPGITSAYAALDLEGNIVKLKSAKNFTLAMMIEELIYAGKPIIIGVDVKTPPDFVKKLATKLNAIIINPKFDMPVGQKIRMVADRKVKPHDDHQRDALSAAFFAFQEIKPLLTKVEYALKKEGKEHLRPEIQELVIRGTNITDAFSLLEEKPEIYKPKKRTRDKIKRQNFLIEENLHLKHELQEAKHQIASLTGQLKNLQLKNEKEIVQRSSSILSNKEKTLQILESKITDLEREKKELQEKIEEYLKFFMSTRHRVIAKKIPNLSKESISLVNPDSEDILLVDDPNTFSQSACEELKQLDLCILTRKKPTPVLEKYGLTIIGANNLHIEENSHFALIDPEELKKEKEKKEILFKIVQDYREKRKETW